MKTINLIRLFILLPFIPMTTAHALETGDQCLATCTKLEDSHECQVACMLMCEALDALEECRRTEWEVRLRERLSFGDYSLPCDTQRAAAKRAIIWFAEECKS